MVYKAQKGEYLFDVAAKLYGDTGLGITRILELNPELNIDSDLFGVSVTYTNERRRKPVFNREEKKKNEYFYAYDLQSIYDISLQLFGNLTGLPAVFGVHTNADQKVAISTQFERVESKDPMLKYYLDNRIIVQTFIVPTAGEGLLNLDNTQLLNLDGTPLFNLS